MLARTPRSVKEWKKSQGPNGWNSPDPMPGTRHREMRSKTRQQLEDTLSSVETALGWATALRDDEEGLKSLSKYGGTAILGGMAAYAIPIIGKGAINETTPGMVVLGIIALACLAYGFMSERQTARTIVFNARSYDRERVIRALEEKKG